MPGEYQNYLEYFVDSIENDFTAYPDLKEGIGTIALLQAMDKSLKTGVPVKIKDILNEYGLTDSLFTTDNSPLTTDNSLLTPNNG
jgi:hypothetical protein